MHSITIKHKDTTQTKASVQDILTHYDVTLNQVTDQCLQLLYLKTPQRILYKNCPYENFLAGNLNTILNLILRHTMTPQQRAKALVFMNKKNLEKRSEM